MGKQPFFTGKTVRDGGKFCRAFPCQVQKADTLLKIMDAQRRRKAGGKPVGKTWLVPAQ